MALSLATAPLKPLLQYIQSYWTESWNPASWSCFGNVIRSNNDCEGWHNRFNRAAEGQSSLDLYVLIPLMKQEADTIPLTMQLIDEDKLKRYQRASTRNHNQKICDAWDKLVGDQEPKLTTMGFLKAVRNLTAPANA